MPDLGAQKGPILGRFGVCFRDVLDVFLASYFVQNAMDSFKVLVASIRIFY